MRFARRLDEVPPYLFAELERKIAAKRAEGVDVISLGIGDPDLPTPEAIVEAAAVAVRDRARTSTRATRARSNFARPLRRSTGSASGSSSTRRRR
jgi:LL-diaminopimelate aminotransferase